MDYAVNGKNVFTTRKQLDAGKKLPESAQSRLNYIRSHEFSVSTVRDSGAPVVKIRKK